MKQNSSYTTSSKHGNFFVERIRPVPELCCELIELRHQESGAKIIHIANDDPENLFCLSFQTLPYSSNGIAHVLEHLVLCGSKNFPVRDPFFSMTRRSMNTFMNALTGTDYTCYPAASEIPEDFYNLLTVYLDAVFHPLLTPESFSQEAHRLEFVKNDDPSSPLTINGVVFNEMKGALTNPMRRLMRVFCSSLFPDTPYGFDSGGDPKEIPSLTLEELKQFHSTYYHPSRCLFFFYGNMPLDKHLEILEEKILKEARVLPKAPPIPRQQKLLSPVYTTAYYPLPEGEETEKKAYISFGWLTANIEETMEALALSLLDIILLDTDGSPLKLRLLQSQHCRQISSFCDTEMPQIPFGIIMTGCGKEDLEPLSQTLFTALEEIATDGIELSLVDHAIHQLELAKSEIGSDYGPFGLSLYSRAGMLSHYGLDPMLGLEIHSLFQEFRETLRNEPTYLQRIIRKHFIENTHFCRILMLPNASVDLLERETENSLLQAIRSTLTEADCRQIVSKNKALHALQEKEQDLSCLPTIHLSEVPKKAKTFHLSRGAKGSVDWFTHQTFTNDLVYLDLHFPLPYIPKEDLWLVRLFTSLLPQLGCGNRGYQEVLEYLQAYTGGVFTSTNFNVQAHNPHEISPSFALRGKAFSRNVPRLVDIMTEMLLSPSFDDRKRIQEIIEKRYTDLENSLPNHAMEYASSMSHSSLSESLNISEIWYGLSYLQKLRELVRSYPEREAHLLETLKNFKQTILCTSGAHIVACADPSNILTLEETGFHGLVDLPLQSFTPWKSVPYPDRSTTEKAFVISSSVSYTTVASSTTAYSSPDAPKLAILAELLNDVVLHRELRETGGAYGGGASASSSKGTFSFYSYKDPHLFRTLQAFEHSLKIIEQGQFSDSALEEAKLGVFQNLDTPVSPGSRAEVAYSWWRQGKTESIRQAYRDGLFSATKEDLQNVIPKYFREGWSKGAFVAFAGQDLISQNQSLFTREGRPLSTFSV